MIPCTMVAHSFKKCGISNHLDGTEDHVLFEDVCERKAADADSDADSNDACLWDDAVVPVPAAFLDSDDDSDFEGF